MVADGRITEPSGLVASRRHPGVFWTLCDSGGPAAVFAIDADGRLLGEYRLRGAENRDWEDIAIDGDGRLYVADTGNNAGRRRDLAVYRVREPAVVLSRGRLEIERRIAFRYPWTPDGRVARHDSEALFHAHGRLYLVTKVPPGKPTTLYRFPEGRGTKPVVLQTVRALPIEDEATAADATRDGRLLAVLTYASVLVFERPEEGDDYFASPRARAALDRRTLRQCEGLAWTEDGLLVLNEDGALFRIPWPPPAAGVTRR
jgi:sugar lactone lactonase YvrE